jgi:hypothetical protein
MGGNFVSDPEIVIPAAELPSCQACGRQDETLRIATYPFVVSVVFITFQRQFSGLWCSRHRTQYWLQAGLITSIIGWLGFPFGLLFTPIQLFQLMKGGIQPVEANAVLLKRLGEKKMQEGNSSAAIKCFEASLQYMDVPEVRERLQRLYTARADQESVGMAKKIGLYLAVIFGFAILGLLVGIVDYFFSYYVATAVGDTNLIVSILLWTPFVTMVFLSISLLRCVVEWVVRFTGQTRAFPSFFLGVAALFVFIYNSMSGEMVADLIIYSINGQGFESVAELIFAWVLTFLLGGVDYLLYVFSVKETWAIILEILLLVSIISGVVVLWIKSREWAKWQTLLESLRATQWNRNINF